jgi:hypothetical protein
MTDSAHLSPDDLRTLTGGRQKRTQIRWLKERHWHYELDRHGHPIVSRAYHDRRMAGEDATPKSKPNYGVFGDQKTATP